MYKSPIKIFESEQMLSEQVAKNTDEYIYKAIVNLKIDVDKDELIKALRYDRGQYEKGYQDALLGFKDELVRVINCIVSKIEKLSEEVDHT